MSNNIKGITIEIGGDTGPLASSLKELDTPINKIQSELKEVNKQLKFDPTNTTLLKQKQDLLAQSADALKEKQAVLKDALVQVQAQFEKGDLGADKVRAVQREYEKVTSQLKDVQKQETEVQKSSGTLGDRIKAAFTSMGSSIKSAFTWDNIKTAIGSIGVAVTGLLKTAISSATTAEEKTDTLSNLLQNQGMTAKNAGDMINQFTGNITKMSSFSAGEAKDALQVLIEKGVSVNNALKESSTVANIAAGSHKSLSEAADLLASAYNGKTKALTALGILTKDEAKQLGDSENATISMTTVQERLNERFGGAAQAQLSTYAGKMKENTNEINSANTAIGTALLPILAKVSDIASKVLVPIANFIRQNPQLSAAILAIIALVGILIGGLSLLTTVLGIFNGALTMSQILITGGIMLAIIALIAIVAVVIANWKPISAFFINLWKTVSDAFINTWNGIKTFFSNLFSWIGNFFSQWGPLILAVVAPFIGIPLLIVQHWGQIQDFFIKLWASITNWFSQLITNTVNFAKQWGPLILAAIVPFIGIPLLIIQHWGQITAFFSKLVQSIGQFFSKLPEMIGYALGTALGMMVKWQLSIASWIVTEIPKLINNIGTFFAELPGKIWDAAVAGIQRLHDFEWSIINWAAVAIPTFLNNVGNFFAQLPGKIWDAAIAGLQKLTDFEVSIYLWAATAIPQFVNTVGGFFSQIPGKVWGGIVGAISGLSNWGGQMVETGKTAAVNAVGGITGFFSSLPDKLKDIGKNVVKGLWDGITGAWKTVTDGVKKLTDGFVSGFKNALGIHSPSTVFAGIGGFVSEGLANGISDKAGSVANALQGIVQSSTSALTANLMGSGGLQAAFDKVANGIKTVLPSLNSSAQVSTAMSAAQGSAQAGFSAGAGKDTVAAQSAAQAPVFQQHNEFYSPKALSPSEAARQTRNATRQMILALKG